jgi:alpha-amylase
MSFPVVLSLVLHNHQPVGNFPDVFERAYRQSYLPMIEALERHPAIPLGLHYSGPLLDWLEESHPDFFPRLQRLVNSKQVELLTGGYYEPILAVIPEGDQQGQVLKLTRYLHSRLGATVRGLWLAERVWEPHLAKPISQSGVEYTIVDDAHFFAVGLREEELRSYFVTEHVGATLKVFPSRRSLRYLIPWHAPSEVIAYLRGFQGTSAVLFMGDDGEKFGLWPGTYAHSWEHGWVDAFFSALESEHGWLTVQLPAQVTATRAAAGRIYLPTASYDEMSEWALPADRSAEFAMAKERLSAAHDPAAAFLRGGFWRHFLVKYPEINTMHKKMLRVSIKVSALPAGSLKEKALDELWRAQGNCPYWHGVFGGIYLPHLRTATYAHLIAADTLATSTETSLQGTLADLDSDSLEEVEMTSPAMTLTVDPVDGGSLVEWDWNERRVNLVNVLTRRPEAYHRQLLQGPGGAEEHSSESTVETIHTQRVRTKEAGLDRVLVYDRYRRTSFIDHLLLPEISIDAFARGEYQECGDFITQPYLPHLRQDREQVQLTLVRDGEASMGETRVPVRIEKQFTLTRDPAQLVVSYRISTSQEQPLRFIFGVETNWGMTDPSAAVVLNEVSGAAREIRAVPGIGEIVLKEEGWHGSVRMTLSIPAHLWHFPLEAVSNSEAGFERTFQGMSLLCRWPLEIRADRAWEGTLVTVLSLT